jgi:phosphoribosylformylglycinamidine cyclo-ligase
MTARVKKEKLITNEKIEDGNVIIGFSSFGITNYESEYNSGLGSNGLTSARHDVLEKFYANNFPETFESTLPNEVVYIGKNRLTQSVQVNYKEQKINTTIGKLLLSPTRTYAPFVKILLEKYFNEINGIIHCSGGGQTKCMKYLHKNFKIIKDNLFETPEIFNIIQQSSGSDNREMYQVFNMGHRLEIFVNEKNAEKIIQLASEFNLEAKIIGRVENSPKKELILKGSFGEIVYDY